MVKADFKSLIDELILSYGPQFWWPADSSFEVIVGAILTQNTAWSNVTKAVSNLKQADLLSPQKIVAITESDLAEKIKPSGFFRQKAKYLQIFCNWYLEKYHGDINQLRASGMEKLRAKLLELKGIGPETADAILCYACDFPIFVVDAYTLRILGRHNIISRSAKYMTVSQLAEKQLLKDTAFLKEAHAVIVKTGKDYCKKSKPNCRDCPLGKYL